MVRGEQPHYSLYSVVVVHQHEISLVVAHHQHENLVVVADQQHEKSVMVMAQHWCNHDHLRLYSRLTRLDVGGCNCIFWC